MGAGAVPGGRARREDRGRRGPRTGRLDGGPALRGLRDAGHRVRPLRPQGAGQRDGGRADADPGGPPGAGGLRVAAPAAHAGHRGTDRGARARADEGRRAPGEHLTRGDRGRGGPGQGHRGRAPGRRGPRRLRRGADHGVAAVRLRPGRRDAAPRRVDRGGPGQGRSLHRRAGPPRADGRVRAPRGERLGRGGGLGGGGATRPACVAGRRAGPPRATRSPRRSCARCGARRRPAPTG